MSVVLSLPPQPRSPHHFPLSRSATPTSRPQSRSRPTTPTPSVQRIRSRPCTPTPPALPPADGSDPISAPPTPVTTTHIVPTTMERCQSSDAALASTQVPPADQQEDERGGRRRHVKATSLLFKSVPSGADIANVERDGQLDHVGSDHAGSCRSTPVVRPADEDLRMDVDEIEVEVPVATEKYQIWGMPKWGWEEGRKQVRKGVRLVGVDEFTNLVDQLHLNDTPSHVLFPWLHGISDDGRKGQDMAAFFGHAPPFEPPSYRGLCVLLAPPHPKESSRAPPPEFELASLDSEQPQSPTSARSDLFRGSERSETTSTASSSWRSNTTATTATTAATSMSVADWVDPNAPDSKPEREDSQDVQMHPCEYKRVATAAPKSADESPSMIPGAEPRSTTPGSMTTSDSSDDAEDGSDAYLRPSSILLNALHVQDIFDLPPFGSDAPASFRQARLPNQINLRNLNIQQVKYATISDIVLYGKHGVNNGLLEIAEKIALAQEQVYEARMSDFYAHHQDREDGEGVNRPIQYGVWVLVEPFHKVEAACPHLVNLDHRGNLTENSHYTDLFEREAAESRAMTRGSEVVEGFWVGNDCDVPGCGDDGIGAEMSFDLCVRASECCDMPSAGQLTTVSRRLQERDKRKQRTEETEHSWVPSPATLALRNLLSPALTPVPPSQDVGSKRTASPSPQEHGRQRRRRSVPDRDFVSIECAGSCRTITGGMRNLSRMTNDVVDFVYYLRKLVEGRDKTGRKRRVLVHCQDGYTESSIVVLAYIMSSLSISLPEAFVHLQTTAKRSFFLYPSDKPLLRKVDARLAADRRAKAIKIISMSPPPAASPARWKSWGLGFGGKSDTALAEGKKTVDVARELLLEEENGGSEAALAAKMWFDDRRFDGFPSRILPFMYLGNLEHAGNAGMLHAIGITHVVSVGESLINCPPDCDPMYGMIGSNTLCAAAKEGAIKVLDLTDIRDDGNDPLRPLIARACAWIEAARQEGGTVLVHCRVGVSRSASIVIAYLMQYDHMGLMDAYLLTRARRLNVLIQPNLRFFHELFGWEVELARKQAAEGGPPRRIVYSWPSFCRDLHVLNRRFLCN